MAVDPAIIFTAPSPFSVSSRFSVQGKPEVFAAYDDSQESAGDNRGDKEQEQEQDKANKTEDAGGDS